MRISPMALGVTLGVVWGASMGIIGTLHALIPDYGSDFLKMMASLYPGILDSGTMPGSVAGILCGLVDGFLVGFVVAWVYNFVLTRIVRT